MRTDPIFRNRPIAALAVICLGVFVISVDATIVNVALPTLSRELGADTAQLQWIVDAYTLVMSGLLLSAGSLSDRFGRRGSLSLGLALFALTSGVAAQVNSADALIAARAAMGVGAAVIFPTTLGLITNIFTDPVPRAKAIGLWAAMVGVGVAVGTDQRRLAARTLLVGLDLHGEHPHRGAGHRRRRPVRPDLARPGGAPRRRRRPDPVRGRNHDAGLHGHRGAHVGMDQRPDRGRVRARRNRSRRVRRWERRSTHPMLDVSVFGNRRFSGGSLAVTAGFLTLFGFIFVITQYFQFIKDYTAFQAGVRLLPVAGSIALASIAGPRLVEWVGTTAVVAAGLAVFAAGLAWASTADAATPYTQIGVQMLLLGGGLGLTVSPATEAIMGSLSAGQGRGRLGRQRHDARTRRHPRRGHRRQHLRVGVLGTSRSNGPAGIARRGDAALDGVWRTR